MDQDGYFGESVAARYDETAAERFAPDVVGAAVDFLANLAGDGRALEFAVGTGRIAVPLSERGVAVSGIELSRAMVAKLRERPGGEAMDVAIGDMTTTTVGGEFRVVYLVYNTIMNLTTQDAQVACFRNAAADLEPGGCFAIECMVPELRRLPPGDKHRVFFGSQTYWGTTSTTSCTRALSRITSRKSTVGSSGSRCRLGTSGRRSST